MDTGLLSKRPCLDQVMGNRTGAGYAQVWVFSSGGLHRGRSNHATSAISSCRSHLLMQGNAMATDHQLKKETAMAGMVIVDGTDRYAGHHFSTHRFFQRFALINKAGQGE